MRTLSWPDDARISLVANRLCIESAAGNIEIDLADCHAQWRARHPGAAGAGLRSVGERDILAQPPYFHFFAGDGVRVQLRAPRRRGLPFLRPRRQAENAFLALQQLLQDAGWTTRDLS